MYITLLPLIFSGLGATTDFFGWWGEVLCEIEDWNYNNYLV